MNKVGYFFKTIPPVYELFHQLPYHIGALVLLPYIQNGELFSNYLKLISGKVSRLYDAVIPANNVRIRKSAATFV